MKNNIKKTSLIIDIMNWLKFAQRSLLLTIIASISMMIANNALADSNLAKFITKIDASELYEGADSFGEVKTSPAYVEILKSGKKVGYVILTTDYVSSIGYSGKPIHTAVGLDDDGIITGTKLVKHSEPIVLVGIPEKRIAEFMRGYNSLSVVKYAERARDSGEVDMISGATVTIMVIEDAIFRAAIKFARQMELGGLKPIDNIQKSEIKIVDKNITGIADWQTLLGDGSIRRRLITIEEINNEYAETGNKKAIERSEKGDPNDVFIDFYIAPVSVPKIGRSLLGDAEYNHMLSKLKDGQQAVLVFAEGRYSFKGTGYVRGGVFDRIQLIQGENSTRFRDKMHKRIGDIMAEGAPKFREIALFRIPLENEFDVTEGFRIELLANRAVGAIKKIFLAFDLGYQLPDQYIKIEKVTGNAANSGQSIENNAPLKLWQRMWKLKFVDAIVLCFAIGVLTVIFFSQDILVKHPKILAWVRNSFLTFTVLWLGFYAQAQLSVVNIFTFFNSFVSGFAWDYFLMEPMIFLLWGSVAVAILFWGRGAYCGWLCPFGALQELLNKLAKLVKIPQFLVPWGLHERLWPIKYMIFLGLFGLSIYSLTEAEHWAEIEPFKTSIILKFAREWPFVLYSLTLLVAGLFVERFYCRYLCPLGAALAIPGRLRMFDWLKRYKECGSPCQRCANECMVQAIHPEGHINPNECLSCLHCQEVYCDEYSCPVVIAKRLKRERRQARAGVSQNP